MPLLDSDVLIDFLRGYPQAIKFMSTLPGRASICSVSVAELYAGVRDGAERQALIDLLSTLEIHALTEKIAASGGLFRRNYGRSHGVGLVDALIAATAVEHDLQLFTLNVKHYPMLTKSQLKQAYAKSH